MKKKENKKNRLKLILIIGGILLVLFLISVIIEYFNISNKIDEFSDVNLDMGDAYCSYFSNTEEYEDADCYFGLIMGEEYENYPYNKVTFDFEVLGNYDDIEIISQSNVVKKIGENRLEVTSSSMIENDGSGTRVPPFFRFKVLLSGKEEPNLILNFTNIELSNGEKTHKVLDYSKSI